jgi:4-amino-4-deoxy-L-arabinose transferase-like glycosyltransferase
MSLRLGLSFLLSLGGGLLLVRLAWPDRGRLGPSVLFRLSLAAGLGVGIFAEVYFLWRLASAASTLGLVIAELAVLGGLGGVLFYRRNRPAPNVASPETQAPDRSLVTLRKFLTIAVLLAIVPAAYVFASALQNQPHGGWDAWMSWNLRARFFFRGGEHWRDTFSNLFWGANPEYPVLLPSVVARFWQYCGSETTLAPALVAFLFTFGAVALASASSALARSPAQGRVAALLLLGTPLFIRHGTFQMADIPLSFFFLATLVTLCVGDRLWPDRKGPLFLTGLGAGFAVWTKNEGFLFLAALIVSIIAVVGRQGTWKGRSGQSLAFVGGLLAVLPLALFVKFRLAPPDIMLGWNAARVHDVIEWPRYWQILKAFGFEALRFGNWPIQIGPVLLFYALLLGIDTEQTKSPSTRIAAGTLGLTLVGYGFAYLTTPQELAWQLRTSMDRLLLQLWPSTVFLYLLVVRPPEQAFAPAAAARPQLRR